MDTNSLMVSFVFGLIGMGMFMFGKKAGRFVPIVAGLALMVVPYMIANLIVLSAVCAGLMLAPLLIREG